MSNHLNVAFPTCGEPLGGLLDRMHDAGILSAEAYGRMLASSPLTSPDHQIGNLQALLAITVSHVENLSGKTSPPHGWLLKRLVRQLVDRFPLPWHVDVDWAVEVLTENGDCVMKCMDDEQVNALITLAERVASDDATGETEVGQIAPADRSAESALRAENLGLRALIAEACEIGQQYTRALRATMPNAERIADADNRLAEIAKESR